MLKNKWWGCKRVVKSKVSKSKPLIEIRHYNNQEHLAPEKVVRRWDTKDRLASSNLPLAMFQNQQRAKITLENHVNPYHSSILRRWMVIRYQATKGWMTKKITKSTSITQNPQDSKKGLVTLKSQRVIHLACCSNNSLMWRSALPRKQGKEKHTLSMAKSVKVHLLLSKVQEQMNVSQNCSSMWM